jgi:orotidine-5'-phosphate decarboxylase
LRDPAAAAATGNDDEQDEGDEEDHDNDAGDDPALSRDAAAAAAAEEAAAAAMDVCGAGAARIGGARRRQCRPVRILICGAGAQGQQAALATILHMLQGVSTYTVSLKP